MGSAAAAHPDINDPNAFVLYRYHPSLPAAIVFVVCFLVSTSIHIFQAGKHRTYYFVPLIIGGIFEVSGYVGRALASNNQYNLTIYIFQIILLLVAPTLFAASIYMVLGRLVLLTEGEKLAPIRSRWLTKIFVCGDVLSFFVQSGGSALIANAKSMTFGKHLVVFGLWMQIFFFGIFLITSLLFHYRIYRCPTPTSITVSWQKYIFTLYAASALILVRSVFRVIEFSGGNDGILLRNEVFLYIFDAVLMLGVMAAFNLVHPGWIIGRKAQGQMFRLQDLGMSSDGFALDTK